MLTLIDLQDSPTFDGQAVADKIDWNAALGGDFGTFVFTGMAVAQHTGSDMECTVALGNYYVNGVSYTSSAAAQVTVTTASGTDRKDIVVAGAGVTLNATHTNGSGAVTSLAVVATLVAIPTGSTIVMANGDQVVTSAPASLGATAISIVSQTPSAGSGWVSGTVVAPLWVVAGTACGTAGWTRTNATSLSTPPPVKAAIPSGTCLLSEVYVSSSTTVITTAANLVDKTNVVGLAGQAIGNINMGAFNLINAGSVLVGESTSSNQVSVETADTTTYTNGPKYFGLNINNAPTFNTTNIDGTSAWVRVGGIWTVNKVSNIAAIYGMNFAPTWAGTGIPANFGGVLIAPVWNPSSGTLSSFYGMRIRPSLSTGTITSLTYLTIGTNAAGAAVTTGVGLDIGVTDALSGSTVWAMTIGAYNSYFSGLTTFGGSGTPTFAVHIQGTNGGGAIGFTGLTTQTQRNASNSGSAYFYKGASSGNWFWVTEFNKAGTTAYTSYRVDSTGTITVTAGSALPT